MFEILSKIIVHINASKFQNIWLNKTQNEHFKLKSTFMLLIDEIRERIGLQKFSPMIFFTIIMSTKFFGLF